MSDFPKFVEIEEDGPREGFQIEKNPIPTARKIELIDALSGTGVRRIQIASFVRPDAVPNMADSEDVVAGITPAPGVEYTGLWLNEKGLERAIATKRLTIEGGVTLAASETFLKRNQNRTLEEQIAGQKNIVEMYQRHGVPVHTGNLMAAFGCNFEGDIPEDKVIGLVGRILEIAEAHGETIEQFNLLDTMAWATPDRIKRLVGRVRETWPEMALALHLHDTRGMGIANAYAGLEMGVAKFDSSIAGMGGCPFAGHAGAAGNVCTEDLVFLCDEMGIETGIDLEKLVACAELAEEIVGHPLPGSVKVGGSLKRLREHAA